jgi:hypothetical protein
MGSDPAYLRIRDRSMSTVLLAVAMYAENVLEVTDGQWPSAARASACREGLRNVAAECRRIASEAHA